MAQTTFRKSSGIQLFAKKTGNHPRIFTITIQKEILRSDKTLSHISHKLFSLLFIKNTIDTKKCNVQPVIVYQGFGDTNIGQRFVLQEFYSFDRKF